MTEHLTSRRKFLQTSALAASALAFRPSPLVSQSTQVDAHIEVLPAEPIGAISPEIYSHFIEQLGGVIYDGVWVGEKSKIPNQDGIRSSFIDMMRAVEAPVLRWPGGCFADSYDWQDGLGPRRQAARPRRLLESAGLEPLRPARVHAHLPTDWLQALPGGESAHPAGPRFLPADRVL